MGSVLGDIMKLTDFAGADDKSDRRESQVLELNLP
jgi:hypothetical protein